MRDPIAHRERKVNILKSVLYFFICMIIIIPVGCKNAENVYSPERGAKT